MRPPALSRLSVWQAELFYDAGWKRHASLRRVRLPHLGRSSLLAAVRPDLPLPRYCGARDLRTP